ncbi:MAG: conjugal transfer protein TraG N-terminal domain-containing protein [Burkholderiales bacterium]|nr:conjugal transfer protein TraG N-terminal domain-containing protein [Burkholderiales bacterium]
MATPFEIFTYGNGDFIYETLLSISSFFGGGIVQSMVKLAAVTTVLMFISNAVGVTTRSPNMPIDYKFFIKFYVIYAMLVGIGVGRTGSTIVITDVMDNSSHTIAKPASNSIPLGLIVIDSFTSKLFNGLIQAYEKYFQTGASGDPSLSYTKSGMAFGSNFVTNLATANTGDAVFNENLRNYFANCGLPIANSQGALSQVSNSSDLIAFFVSNFTDVQQARYVKYIDQSGNQVPITCLSAITSLQSTWTTKGSSWLNDWATKVGYNNPTQVSNFVSASNTASGAFLQLSNSGSDAMKQAIAMNTAYQAIQSSALETGNDALALSAYDAMQFQQYKAGGELSGEQASRIMPAMKNFAEALALLLYPLIIFFALLTSSFTPVTKYVKIVATINAIPFVYELLSYSINWYASVKTGSIAAMSGYNLMSATNMYSLNANIVSAANWMAMSTPALAYMLISGSEMAFTGIFAHGTDAGKSIATTTSNDMSKGNVTMGNESIDNQNYGNISHDNLSANKFNNQLDMSYGSSQMNERLSSGSSVSRYADGSSNIAQQQSNLRVTPAMTEAIQSSVGRTASEAIASRQSAGHQIQDSFNNAQSYINKYGTSEQKSEMASLGRDINSSVSGGFNLGKSIVGKLTGISAGVDLNTKMSSGSNSSHSMGNSHGQETQHLLQQFGQSVNSYNNAVDQVTQSQMAVSFAQSHAGSLAQNLSTPAWQEAYNQSGGDLNKAESLVNNRQWMQNYVDNTWMKNRQMTPQEFENQHGLNTTQANEILDAHGGVNGANGNLSNEILNEQTKQNHAFDTNKTGKLDVDSPGLNGVNATKTDIKKLFNK